MIRYSYLFIFCLILFSCGRKDVGFVYEVYKTPATSSAFDLVSDSSYLYAREAYLWNESLKPYDAFNPRQYNKSNLINTADAVMQQLRAVQPKDNFSFATSIEESDGIVTGNGTDWGFFVQGAYIANPATNDNVRWFVTYVYKSSDAWAKNVRRGWFINKINGTVIRGDDASVALLNDLLFGTSTSAVIEFGNMNGSSFSTTINKTKFQANSVLYSNVFTNGSKKTGYIVFNQFFDIVSQDELTNVLTGFQSQGITDLIIDLRNNGGGSTNTQDFFANYIAPSSAEGKTMYTYEYNNTLQKNKFVLLRKKFTWAVDNTFNKDYNFNTVKFSSTGRFSLSKLVFIVTRNTASASELLINNLKPVMDVKLIGDTTYGKPVGFFPIKLLDQVAIYPISFRTINGSGTSDYYNGFAPDFLAQDAFYKDWGDVTDPCLAAALSYINLGRYQTVPSQTIARSVKSKSVKIINGIGGNKFSGMFMLRK